MRFTLHLHAASGRKTAIHTAAALHLVVPIPYCERVALNAHWLSHLHLLRCLLVQHVLHLLQQHVHELHRLVQFFWSPQKLLRACFAQLSQQIS
jgi:hypothetical protein